MNYAACMVPVAAMRLEPDHRSEMVSQFLFGEYAVLHQTEKDGWVLAESKSDGYRGWCQQTHFQPITPVQYAIDPAAFAADWVNHVDMNGRPVRVPFGSSLPVLYDEQGSLGENTIRFPGKSLDPLKAERETETIRGLAFMYLNTAYLWGGRSVFGVDCSGFTQMIYRMMGISLLRDAQQQATQGELINFLQEARCGDLAFFDDAEGRIIHVGMLLSPMEIIHASGKVRIDRIDNSGIVQVDTGQRTQRLRIIRRYC